MKANKIILFFSITALFFNISTAQTQKSIHFKKSNTLYIKINSEINLGSRKNLLNSVLQKIPLLKEIYNETPFQLKKGIPLSEEKLQALENKGVQKKERKKNWFSQYFQSNCRKSYTREITGA